MQRIEPDAVGAQSCRKLDQAFEIGEIADPPIARRADAVELHRQQPAAVEIAAEGLLAGATINGTSSRNGRGIGQLQPVGADRQIRPARRSMRSLALAFAR